MKTLIVSLLLALTSSLASAELTLDIKSNPDNTRTIIHNQDEWYFVVKASTYSVFIDKSILSRNQKTVEFHSITEFDNIQKYDGLPFEIKRIYSYGVLNCEESKLYLLSDLFTDQDNIIRHVQAHDFGTYVTNLSVANSIAKDIRDAVCGEII